MTLKEINEIEDKEERLKRLEKYIAERMESQRGNDENEVASGHEDEYRDEAGGMMSRFGKPGD